MTSTASSVRAALTAGLVSAAITAPLLASPTATAASDQLVVNGGFEKGVAGWRTNADYMTFTTTTAAKNGGKAIVLKTRAGSHAVLNDTRNTVRSTKADTTYTVSAWVRTNVPGLSGQVRVREVTPAGATIIGKSIWLTDTGWHKVSFSHKSRTNGAELDLNVLGWHVKKSQRLYVDSVSMTAKPTTGSDVVTDPGNEEPQTPPGLVLSNGARLSTRGVAAPGHPLVGAAIGGNTDPAAFEKQIGQRLGVRRTYWGPGGVRSAVRTARADLAAGRLPWISFKLPHSWSKMAAGQGDAWAKNLAAELSKLPGPVWVAFHHEPEGDGPIGDWTRMQERLGPIMRDNAPNVGFTVILTGWNQFYGPSRFHLNAIWPNTKVDVAGFDPYNFYGTTNQHGTYFSKPSDMRRLYFEPISAWAKSKGVAWGLAETGINDKASVDHPTLLNQTYLDLKATGGIAFAYFNTPLNSSTSWVITTEAKRNQFAAVLKKSPTFPKLV